MTDIVDDIHAEHRILSRLLACLEREVDVFARGERPDFELIRDILDFLLTWPAACHHPREAVLERYLVETAPEEAATVNLEAEHARLGEQLQSMAQALESILMEIEVSRETFVAMTRNFIARFKYHLAMEEEEFLPLVRKSLTPAQRDAAAKEACSEIKKLSLCRDVARVKSLLQACEA